MAVGASINQSDRIPGRCRFEGVSWRLWEKLVSKSWMMGVSVGVECGFSYLHAWIAHDGGCVAVWYACWSTVLARYSCALAAAGNAKAHLPVEPATYLTSLICSALRNFHLIVCKLVTRHIQT